MDEDHRPIAVEEVPVAEDAGAVVALADAFASYPMLRYLIGADLAPDAVAARRTTLLAFFVAARRARGEPVLGVRDGDGWAAVALATLPDAAPTGALDAARARTWTILGPDARARYEAMGARWQAAMPTGVHVHLNLVGVRAARRGRGYGSALVRAVLERAAARPGVAGVTLTTETAANVGLYRALGFEVVAELDVAPDLRSWVMRCAV